MLGRYRHSRYRAWILELVLLLLCPDALFKVFEFFFRNAFRFYFHQLWNEIYWDALRTGEQAIRCLRDLLILR